MASIFERMVKGESLSKICEDEAMPDRQTVYRWREAYPELRDRYARAREALMDFYADQIVMLAYDDTKDTMNDGNKLVANHAAVARDRLKVDTLKWIMSKLSPRQYGDGNQILNKDGLTREEAMDQIGAPITKIERVIVSWEKHDPPPPPEPAKQITFNPGPLPAGIESRLLIDIIDVIRECVPDDDTRPTSEVMGEVRGVIHGALRQHYTPGRSAGGYNFRTK